MVMIKFGLFFVFEFNLCLQMKNPLLSVKLLPQRKELVQLNIMVNLPPALW